MTRMPSDPETLRTRQLAEAERETARHILGTNRSGAELIAGSQALHRREHLVELEASEHHEQDAWRHEYAAGLWRVSCVTDDPHERIRFGEYALLTAADIHSEKQRIETMWALADIDPESVDTAALLIPRSGSWLIRRLGDSTASILRGRRSPRARVFERSRRQPETLFAAGPLPAARGASLTAYRNAVTMQVERDLDRAGRDRRCLSDTHGKVGLPEDQGTRLVARLDWLDGEEQLYANAPEAERLQAIYDSKRIRLIGELAWHNPQAARVAVDRLSERVKPPAKLTLLTYCYDREPDITIASMQEYMDQFEHDPSTRLELAKQAEGFFRKKTHYGLAKEMRRLQKQLRRS
ncbi:MAG: hypothetical protein WD603_00655 [Patescibacteria group bacterium]